MLASFAVVATPNVDGSGAGSFAPGAGHWPGGPQSEHTGGAGRLAEGSERPNIDGVLRPTTEPGPAGGGTGGALAPGALGEADQHRAEGPAAPAGIGAAPAAAGLGAGLAGSRMIQPRLDPWTGAPGGRAAGLAGGGSALPGQAGSRAGGAGAGGPGHAGSARPVFGGGASGAPRAGTSLTNSGGARGLTGPGTTSGTGAAARGGGAGAGAGASGAAGARPMGSGMGAGLRPTAAGSSGTDGTRPSTAPGARNGAATPQPRTAGAGPSASARGVAGTALGGRPTGGSASAPLRPAGAGARPPGGTRAGGRGEDERQRAKDVVLSEDWLDPDDAAGDGILR